ETPPPYTPSSTSEPSSSSTLTPERQYPPLPRQNHLSISRHNASVKGTWVIDPQLQVPTAALPPLAPGVVRKNFELQADNGSINAEVWIVSPDQGNTDKKTAPATVHVKGCNGNVNVQMRHPFRLTVTANNGGVTVAIPRSFCGPLTTITRNGWVSIDSSLAPHVTTFSEVKGTRKCFVGDFSSSNYGQEEWNGSSLEVDCHNGKIKVRYVDEVPEERQKSPTGGVFGKLFSVLKD
ncbi:hypothetical protein BD410DRAFT_719430, partial [Rickenella mellea]